MLNDKAPRYQGIYQVAESGRGVPRPYIVWFVGAGQVRPAA